MSRLSPFPGRAMCAFLLVMLAGAGAASAQKPIDATQSIIIKQSKPKTQYAEFKGAVMHANIAQITVRGKENELAVRTFPLSREAAEGMQKIIDRGGYQYGDKVTIVYDPVTQQAVKIKGKPSRPI